MKLSEISDIRDPKTLVGLKFKMKTVVSEFITPVINGEIETKFLSINYRFTETNTYKIIEFANNGQYYIKDIKADREYIVGQKSMAKIYEFLEILQKEPKKKISIDQYLINEYEDKNNASHKG